MKANRLGQYHRLSVAHDVWVDFSSNIFQPSNPCLAWAVQRKQPSKNHAIALVVDAGLLGAFPNVLEDIHTYVNGYSEALNLLAPPKICPGGEVCKSDPAIVADLQEWMAGLGAHRQVCVLALGGGALLDVVGFAAATVHRGLRLVRLPSTVGAQAASAVSMKNAINAFGNKDILGTFAAPFGVLADGSWLARLAVEDKRAGAVEAIKVAILCDLRFFEWIEENTTALAAGESSSLLPLVRRSAALHLQHTLTGGDPFELECPSPLDFGRSVAHCLENASGFALRHGEALGIAIALEALYSLKVGLLAEHSCQRVLSLLCALGLPLFHPSLHLRHESGVLRVGLERPEGRQGGYTVLSALGDYSTMQELRQDVLEAVIDELQQRFGAAEDRAVSA